MEGRMSESRLTEEDSYTYSCVCNEKGCPHMCIQTITRKIFCNDVYLTQVQENSYISFEEFRKIIDNLKY